MPKKYKILKELPSLPVGSIVDITTDFTGETRHSVIINGFLEVRKSLADLCALGWVMEVSSQHPLVDYIDIWYDRNTKSFVLQRKDDVGNQLRDAEYYPNKELAYGNAVTYLEGCTVEIKGGKIYGEATFKIIRR